MVNKGELRLAFSRKQEGVVNTKHTAGNSESVMRAIVNKEDIETLVF